MRFIGSHQIIKTEESSNRIEPKRCLEQDREVESTLKPSCDNYLSSTQHNGVNSTEQSATQASSATYQDIHALLLIFVSVVLLLISEYL